MDRGRYAELLRTLFDPNPHVVGPILSDLLAVASDGAVPPLHHVNRTPTTELADAVRAVTPAYRAAEGWTGPLHLENVRGPASVPSLIGAVACLLKNPNLFDRAGGQAAGLESTAIASLSGLVFPGVEGAGGVFTAGGTHSNLYGARLGIEKACPGAMSDGLRGKSVVGVASEASHFSNRKVAGWLGIGSNNLLLIPTVRNLAIHTDALANTLDRLYRAGHTVAYVVATVGTTDGFGCDDIAAVRRVTETAAATHNAPVPHIHADAAIGWPLAFFHGYDPERNPLGLSTQLLPVIRKAMAAVRGLRHADSVTVDFHKMGYGHYPTSAFLVRRRDDLQVFARTSDGVAYHSSGDEPGAVTLETSRPALGPYIVTASLAAISREGWQLLVARALELAHTLKQRLAALPRCLVLNPDTPGPSVVFWVMQRSRNAVDIFRRLDRGEFTSAEADECFAEVRRLFDQRSRTLDPSRDARLGFTADYGYRPGGHRVPAWKAVFFHPKTDEAVIDRLIESIAALP